MSSKGFVWSTGASALLGLSLLASPVLGQTMQTSPTSPAHTSISPSSRAGVSSSPGTAATPSGSAGVQAPSTGSNNQSTMRSSGSQTAPIDINSASAAQLDALPGIGPARAQAIVANRPFRSKDDLLSRKILPQRVYEGIKDRIVAHRG